MIILGMIKDVMTEIILRTKLNLTLQSTPKEEDSLATTSQSSQAASMFGAARPINPAIREQ